MKRVFLFLSLLALTSCAAPQASSSSSSAASSASEQSSSSFSSETSSSSVVSSSEQSSSASEASSSSAEEHSSSESELSSDSSSEEISVSSDEESLSSSEASSEVSSSSIDTDVPGQGAWTLTSAALPKNPASGKLYNQEMVTHNGKGDEVTFLADDILTGGGTKGDDNISIDNTMQLSKNYGYIYMTSGYATYITFRIAHIVQTYGGEAHDFTGVPTVYSADEMTANNGEVVELQREESEDHHYYTYSCMLPHSRFRLANESGNALYIYEINNLA